MAVFFARAFPADLGGNEFLRSISLPVRWFRGTACLRFSRNVDEISIRSRSAGHSAIDFRPYFGGLIVGNSVSPDAAWVDVPKPKPPWQMLASEPQWHPALAGPDQEFLDTFTDGQDTVERYIALFVSHGDNIMHDLGRTARGSTPWERGNIKTAQVRIGDHVHDVEVSEIRSEDGRRRLVWSFYVVGRRVVAGTLRAKLVEVYASMTGARAVAYFAISMPIASADIDHQAKLDRFLEIMTSLDSYIGALN